jgi:hypothetical protein
VYLVSILTLVGFVINNSTLISADKSKDGWTDCGHPQINPITVLKRRKCKIRNFSDSTIIFRLAKNGRRKAYVEEILRYFIYTFC